MLHSMLWSYIICLQLSPLPSSSQSVMLVLEFPLSLTISVPAQTPNWSIVADLTAVLSKVKRSPLQV